MNELLLVCTLLVGVAFVYAYARKVEAFEDPKTRQIHEKLLLIHPLAAKLSIKASNQSFTEDKTRTYLILKDEKGQYYDDNMLMYVAIHELAHAISKQVDPDHKTDEFMNNFKLLLASAENLGLYDPKLPLNYDYCPNTPAIAATNGGKQKSEHFVAHHLHDDHQH